MPKGSRKGNRDLVASSRAPVAGAALWLASVAGASAEGLAGTGESAWGPIAPPDSTNTAAAASVPDPAWEKVVNAPYWVVAFPLRLVFEGVAWSTGELSESATFRRLRGLLPLQVHDAIVMPGISYDSDDGIGGSVSVDVPDFGENHHALQLRVAGQVEGERKSTLGLRFQRTDHSWFEVGGGYRSRPSTRFHGIGPGSREEDESYYHREVSWGGAAWFHRVGSQDFGWALGGFYSGVSAQGSDDSKDPHLSEEFVGALPSGYRNLSEGLTAGLELSHEDSRRVGPPGAEWRERMLTDGGGLRRALVTWFEGEGNQRVDYWTWRAEVQQFIPLWHSRRALAVRGVVARIENEGDDPVPFQRLLTNDEPDVFRGYPDERFHDVGLAALSLEYRWPVWSLKSENSLGLDGYLFADWGQVFSEFEDIESDALTKSYGGGLRFGGEGHFGGRVEIGWSEEGVQFRLRADDLFQYAKASLFHGRSPVPTR